MVSRSALGATQICDEYQELFPLGLKWTEHEVPGPRIRRAEAQSGPETTFSWTSKYNRETRLCYHLCIVTCFPCCSCTADPLRVSAAASSVRVTAQGFPCVLATVLRVFPHELAISSTCAIWHLPSSWMLNVTK
jgi:hypothetical protein